MPLRFQYEERGREARVEAFEGDKRVGYVVADRRSWKSFRQHAGRIACASNIEALVREHDVDTVLVVRSSYLDYELRGTGVGRKLYEHLLMGFSDRHGAVILVPDGCWVSGATSPSARRVWGALRRDWESSGDVIVSLPRQAVEALPVGKHWQENIERLIAPRARRVTKVR